MIEHKVDLSTTKELRANTFPLANKANLIIERDIVQRSRWLLVELSCVWQSQHLKTVGDVYHYS